LSKSLLPESLFLHIKVAFHKLWLLPLQNNLHS
jgi:hypothetical protein